MILKKIAFRILNDSSSNIDQDDIKSRFNKIKTLFNIYGTKAGLSHKRLIIPKDVLSKEDLTKYLNFIPSNTGLGEKGQTTSLSYRNPFNGFHVHDHGDSWIMHRDRFNDLISSFASEKSKSVPNFSKPIIEGASHIIADVIPGLIDYAKGKSVSGSNIKTLIQKKLSPEFFREIERLRKTSLMEKESSFLILKKLAEQVLPSKSEFAPGIPIARKIYPIPEVTYQTPQIWQIALQKHIAVKAGEHMDLRLVDLEGKAHSWAIPSASLPKPGEKVLAIQQPTHTQEYAARKGKFEIPEGYGKGTVQSEGLKPVEIVKSIPGKVLRFNTYGNQKEGNQEYSLIQTPKGHILFNITSTAESGVRGKGGHLIPHYRPKYQETSVNNIFFDNPNEIHQAKVDGANVSFSLRGDKHVKIFSTRPTERHTGVLEHTHKIPNYGSIVVPPSLSGTVLRGELYAEDKKTGKALPAEQVGGLLNASVWRSREKQQEMGAELKPVIYDVVKFKGHDVENVPYVEKLRMLKEVQEAVPKLKLPPLAVTTEEKEALFRRIERGEEPITREGIISWNLTKSDPTKVKFRPDFDAEVVGILPGKGKHQGRMGALQMILPGKRVVTNVGTGLSDELRNRISKDPSSFIGRVAKVRAQQVFPSGKMRAPSFVEFHIEKGNQPEEIEKVFFLKSLAPQVLSLGD